MLAIARTSQTPRPLGVITKALVNLEERAEMKNINKNGKYKYGGESDA